ncbi:DUF1659 domain-containing protein [Pectinatus sottacetonis]|uniref:DUF1659 domain-containing protein n=1 Tax=Pectinatus sottacetonis TaxID=1002795 RepID=UPI0018C66CEF|nr:DUF1659 domain-containing protein [Pectinatus sottacetonis]
MAVTKTDQSTKLIVNVQTGVDANGKAKYGQRNFASINPGVSDDVLLSTGKALGTLQSHQLGTIMRQDECTLSEA